MAARLFLQTVTHFNQTAEQKVIMVLRWGFFNTICNSRSKLAFARGTQSDSIAFVNAFKVMCLTLSTESCSVQWICIFSQWLFLKPSLLSHTIRHGTHPKRKDS